MELHIPIKDVERVLSGVRDVRLSFEGTNESDQSIEKKLGKKT